MKFLKALLMSGGIFAAGGLAAAGAAADEYTLILKRLRGNPKAVKVDMKNFRPDGTWSDVNYQSRNGGRWEAAEHLRRMNRLAAYDRESALKALAAWVRLNPRSPNWWWNCIGTPMDLESVLIRLEVKNVPPDLLKAVRPLLYERPRFTMTGQNLIWVSLLRTKEGLLYREPELVREGIAAASREVEIRPAGKEGLQQDYSYHQHGAQLQFGNYGLSFAADQLHWANVLRGTQFAYSGKKIDHLYNYLMEGLRWTLWDGIMDFSACGRQLESGGPGAKYRAVLGCGRSLLPLLSGERQSAVKTWLDAPQKLYGAKAFPHSGYLVYHHADGWHFSVKMNSRMLIGSETCNRENMQGLYQGDGAAFFGTAARYAGYPALSDARMLPGTTEIQDQRNLKPVKKRNLHGFYAVWAGYPAAVAAYRLDAGDLTADKVYFATSSGVTGSGSDIRSGSKFPVVTCIDQYREESEKDFPVLCETPEGMPPAVRFAGTVHENWKHYFFEQRSRPISGRVVKLEIRHGVKPAGATYFYRLRKAGAARPETRLVTSSPRIHALLAEGRVLTAAFAAGTVTLPGGRKMAVRPGITILDPAGKLLHFEPFRER